MAQRPAPQIPLGEVIRSRREELGADLETIARAAGTDQARISRVEGGEDPGYLLASRIARALSWSLAELVERTEALETAGENRRA
jgi:predicted transcriptional regulator